jgi:hypothetical protein
MKESNNRREYIMGTTHKIGEYGQGDSGKNESYKAWILQYMIESR